MYFCLTLFILDKELLSKMKEIQPLLVVHQKSFTFQNSQLKDAVLKRYHLQYHNSENQPTLILRYPAHHQYESSCIVAKVLGEASFGEMVAEKLPWQLESILDDPLCYGEHSRGYQQQLADILLDLQKFAIFYENDSLRCDLIRYH